jgi:hypothetical protein
MVFSIKFNNTLYDVRKKNIIAITFDANLSIDVLYVPLVGLYFMERFGDVILILVRLMCNVGKVNTYLLVTN